MKLHGRWALVTGASAGLGRAFAEQLAARGMNVVLTARRVERLEQLAAHLQQTHGIRTAIVPADLAIEGEPLRVWREATTVGPIDLLVNNAGFGAQGRFDEIPLGRHLSLLDVNCRAVVALAHSAIGEMRLRGGGAIINVSSLAAFQPVPRIASYAASKAFVLSLSESLSIENEGAGVRIVALCPGRTPTEFQAVAGTGPAEGAFGARTPDEVVRAAIDALARDAAVIVPGIENRAASWAVRVMPRSALMRAMKVVVNRIWKPGRDQRGGQGGKKNGRNS